MKVLIGYDGSRHSDAVLEDIKLAGLPDDSEVMVVTVADLLASGPAVQEVVAEAMPSRRLTTSLLQAQTHAERVKHEAAEHAEEAAVRLRAAFPRWRVESQVLTGTPAFELIDAAKEWNADLVAVGSQGRSAIGRLIMGSVSRKVVTDSHCPVRVARPVERKNASAPPRILIGVDGSPASEEAVREVGRRPWPTGTEVRLMAVHDRPSPAAIAARLPQAAGAIADLNQDAAERSERMLHWATQQLRTIGLNTSISIQRGDPKRILLKEARKINADCIFVGTREFKSGLERLRLGSVSTAVVTNAHCSVEVVRLAE